MKTKILILFLSLLPSSIYALSFSHPHISVAKFLGVPDGISISANFMLSPADIAKGTSMGAKAAMCTPVSAAIVAAGLGPENPLADIAGMAAEAGCVWMVGKAVNFSVKKVCKKGVTTRLVVNEELISIPPATPSYHIKSMSCTK